MSAPQQNSPSSPDAPSDTPTAGADPASGQGAGSTGFRRQRASRACEVRCDAASLGVPCTNCVAFNIECKIPSPKRKKTGSKSKDSDSEKADDRPSQSPATTKPNTASAKRELPSRERTVVQNSTDGIPSTQLPEQYLEHQRQSNGTYAQYMKPKFARAPIKEAGRVAYLGESSNLTLLVQDHHGTNDVVHYPLPDTHRGARARITELDELEIRILHERGAFLLPPRQLCDELVEDFFTWIAPVVPVINRSKFMRRYRDSKNPPSLLLLQAILLAGSRVCSNPQLMDANGSTTPAAMTFYKRAKALYDANYEDDRVTIVQALVLMGWYWEGPEGMFNPTFSPDGLDLPFSIRRKLREHAEIAPLARSSIAADVTKNVFYWSRVAIIVAQGSGMHRSVENSQLSRSDKRLWKRIWWTLFTRDRSVAVALGRPVAVNIDDTDVEMLTADDFVEDEPDKPAEYQPNPVHVQFFLNYVKLCEITGLVLSQNYAVGPQKARRIKAIDLTHSDMALADWLQNCPKEVYWSRNNHHFWSALLHSNYYTTLCLLHRAHMPPAFGVDSNKKSNGVPDEPTYPSRNIAYQAAAMITSIIEALIEHDQLRYTPAFIVYSLFSALLMHVYQLRSANSQVAETTKQRLNICMNALKEISKVWLVGKMVHTLFESILGNKHLEERLQKATGKRHGKAKPAAMRNQAKAEDAKAQKRKFDDLDMGFGGGHPAAQMSYERSRPVSPVQQSREAPELEHQQQPQMPHISTSSPQVRQGQDAFMGMSRAGTRQSTPFNTFSYPGTPPDLFLHTRNSPNISQDLWQNYQPDQLFPPDSTSFGLQSPMQQQQMMESVMRGPAQPPPPPQPAPHRGSQQFTPHQMPGSHMQQQMPQPPTLQSQHGGNVPQNMQHMQFQQPPGGWSHMHHMGAHPDQRQAMASVVGDPSGSNGADDTWSNSSTGGPIVPTTLNVGDWFEFFGIPNNGEMNGLHAQY
ncbi:Cutinase transcription factor 1 alpha [Sphaceloma murrayae]|uniref:Cutinase transcription factor 1 alpha n=1 Tax=Sphaceloma murrayae TaxID=2082308 RepID=A0A2K1QHL1_9PEZI|nr:Cutinase transcription factor 1 alpha [Sphaceloma murrayae]